MADYAEEVTEGTEKAIRGLRGFTILFIWTLTIGVGAMQSSKQIIGTAPEAGLPFSPAVKAGGLVYVSGALVTEGDIKAQTKQVIENLSKTLTAAGSSLANAASVTVYLKDASDFAAMNEVYRSFWPKDPPVRTTVMATLVRPTALVEMAMVAIPTGGERKVIHPADWIASPNPYSYGILSGDTLFLAGLVSRNGKDNSIVEGDITAQTKTVLENAGQILKAAGMTFGDVAASRVYITDTANFQAMNATYQPYFASAPPARATVKAGLMGPQYNVEITLVAVKGGSRKAITTPNADGSAGRANPVLSSAIQVGNRLYLSGMLGNTDATKGNTAAQTKETLARLERTLKAAGFDWSHVVDGVVYLTDVATFDAMNGVYRQTLVKDFPARATVQAGLVAQDGLVEIMLTAVK